MDSLKAVEAVSARVVERLRDERLEKGVTMAVVAEKAGLSVSTISLIERNLRNPTLDSLLRISAVLGLELNDLIRDATSEVRKRR